MKKVKFTFEIESEKLNAFNHYNQDSNTNLNEILANAFQKVYEDVVPEEVRKYLESKIETEQKKPTPSIPKFTKNSDQKPPK